jgi:hypothetical protein
MHHFDREDASAIALMGRVFIEARQVGCSLFSRSSHEAEDFS